MSNLALHFSVPHITTIALCSSTPSITTTALYSSISLPTIARPLSGRLEVRQCSLQEVQHTE